MMWPFNRAHAEVRESSYTDALVQTIVNRAGGTSAAVPAATGALEASASMVARCFAAARVEGLPRYTAAVTPLCRSMIGRALIRRGEMVLQIAVGPDGDVRLFPASDWDVTGDFDPATWVYRVNLAGPSRFTMSQHVSAAGVVHARYQIDPDAPWRGIGPLQSAAIAGRLSAEVAQALADEASGPRGSLLPLPVDGEDPTVTALKGDIRTLNGWIALVESVKTMHPGAATNAPRGEWQPVRLGANPPAGEVELMKTASREVYAATGVPADLFGGQEGTAQRESFRRFLHATIQPLGELVSAELTAKLDTPVRLNFDTLFAADLAGRARAFQSMVGGGMSADKAAALAGLMGAEE